MKEKEIRELIWEIIEEEIEAVTKRRFVKVQDGTDPHRHIWREVKTVDVVMPKIKKRINELLEKEETSAMRKKWENESY